ncbi:MAG: hypothetical protein Q9207_000190 [Kuettlingeria erythrocarpa]
MRPLFSPETRRRLQESNRKWYIKATLQAICILLAFVALVLFAHATALTNQNFNSPHGDWTDWIARLSPLPPTFTDATRSIFQVLIALIFNTLSLTFLFRGKRLHPGWDVTAQLLTWTLGIPSLVIAVLYMWAWMWQPTHNYYDAQDSYDYDTTLGCRYWNSRAEPCLPVIYIAGKAEIAGSVFLGLLIIFSFTLFILACIAAHRHRLAARRSKDDTHNIQLQYHRSPEEHAAQEPPAYKPRSDEEQAAPVATKFS